MKINKRYISKQFDLPATNDAINSNFNNHELHFICEETNLYHLTTYHSLHVSFEMQKKLITQGKMERPQIIYGFTPEDRKEFDEGFTFEELWDRVEKKLGKIEYD